MNKDNNNSHSHEYQRTYVKNNILNNLNNLNEDILDTYNKGNLDTN